MLIFVLSLAAVSLKASAGQPTLDNRALKGGSEELPHMSHILNKYRRRIAGGRPGIAPGSNLKKLYWDSHLSGHAVALSQCAYINRPPVEILEKTSSETWGLALGMTVRGRSLSNIVQRWLDEARYVDSFFYECRSGKSCENFLQLALAQADGVACASSVCDVKGVLMSTLACVFNVRYTIYTRDLALPLYKEGSPCSRCPDEKPFCELGLCVACNHVDSRRCVCRKTCSLFPNQKPEFVFGWGTLNSENCSCDCQYGNGPNCDEPCYDKGPACPITDKERAESCGADFVGDLCPAACGTCKSMTGNDEMLHMSMMMMTDEKAEY